MYHEDPKEVGIGFWCVGGEDVDDEVEVVLEAIGWFLFVEAGEVAVFWEEDDVSWFYFAGFQPWCFVLHGDATLTSIGRAVSPAE